MLDIECDMFTPCNHKFSKRWVVALYVWLVFMKATCERVQVIITQAESNQENTTNQLVMQSVDSKE